MMSLVIGLTTDAMIPEPSSLETPFAVTKVATIKAKSKKKRHSKNQPRSSQILGRIEPGAAQVLLLRADHVLVSGRSDWEKTEKMA